ncbi:ROK family protein [Nakamurella flavida]|uniref:ROK family protein n=1 Tax=Nakamurella flavida TaxID=363630 RepID=A0A939C7G8_9ACTN|nr:ROK family protein [Nakamurella flavida]MBM9478157.1 ROK family protein [Nakamurella flavida]MDP9778621.1 putative NBD/HSP70 family sugar kinase [Nakamurella flavida]
MTDPADGPLTVGVDIGGTKTDAVVLDGAGRILERHRTATVGGSAGVLGTATGVVDTLAAATRRHPAEFGSIGVGIPGRVDPGTGMVAHAVHLGLENLALGPLLADRFGVPVRIENDVNAAAVGAFHVLGMDADRSMAYLNFGTGVAAGIVREGALWRGSGGNAGEVGHIPIDPLGPICKCGQRGCLEMSASGSAVARLWPTAHPRPVQDLMDRAAEGDERARRVWNGVITGIASAVRILVLSVDVDVVVLGGGLVSAGDPVLRAVRSRLGEWGRESSFLSSLALPARVRLLDGAGPPDETSGQPVAALGAAYLGRSARPVPATSG